MEPTTNIFKFFLYFINKYLLIFVIIFFLGGIKAWGQAYFPYYIKFVIDFVDKNPTIFLQDNNEFKNNIIWLLLTFLASEGAMRLNAILIIFYFPALRKKIKFTIFKNCLKLPFDYFNNKLIGTICAKINEVAKSTEKAYEILFVIIAQDFLSIIFFMIVIGKIDKYFAFCIFFLVIIQLFITLKSYKQIQYASDVYANSAAECHGKMVDVFNSIILIKSQNTIQSEENYFHTYQNEELESYKSYLKIFELFNSLRAVATLVFNILIFLFLFYKWKNFTLSAGEFSLVAMISYTVSINIWRLTYQIGKLFLELGIISSGIKSLFNKKLVNSPHPLLRLNIQKSIENFDILFKNVYFKYKQSANFIHNDFSLIIPAKEKLAIIGKTGIGKSSLIKLILGLYNPCKGNIYIDNIDLASLDKEILSEQITFCPQKPCVFKRSLIDNINYLNSKKEDKYIKEIIDNLELTELINNNTDQTFAIETLSEGQKQRVALCRTLLKTQAKIAIFDEPTSALDPKMEGKIIDYIINNWGKEKTIIIITHKYNILSKFNRIISLEDF